ncbi:hypothetical protein PNA2_1907 [Pyrococcus sp. NA2]|uniref:CARDB domain-containing protein n=1 Tax=Pyrococcus sp. (strain NA2) TaxID=342949 RepID=UPI000209AD80|nr:CARDB domain-containing protein [Pyrococcus sp. NA2]AEC52822.1 hypothetical protein PNA2_1907 [Pyrococcus sp. NA2]
MKRKFIILLLLFLVIPTVRAQPVLLVKVSPEEVEGFPGETLVVNVTVINIGNETARNITIYSSDILKGVLFTQGFIQFLNPNSSYTFPMKIFLLKPEAGLYDVHVAAKVGHQIAEGNFKLKVKSIVNFTLSIEGKDRYLYGENVSILLHIDSHSNILLYGNAKAILFKEGKKIKEFSYKPMIKSWGSWTEKLSIRGLSLGNYSLLFEADFYGRKKTLMYNFTVYRRNLYLDARFENGKIIVRVTENGRPVKGIKVWINDREFKTDASGLVILNVKEPGIFIVKANLDGIIKEKIVKVERPIIFASQLNSTLRVRVIDSEGRPINRVMVVAKGPKGTFYSITNENGTCKFDVEKLGLGVVRIEVISDKYLASKASIVVREWRIRQTTTPTPTPARNVSTKTNITSVPSQTSQTTIAPGRQGIDIPLILLLLGFFVTLGSSSYMAFFRPVIVEDMIKGYYFVKVRAPRLRELRKFRYEKIANVKNAWASKGRVEMKEGKVVWEIDKLEPGEEAVLQLILL